MSESILWGVSGGISIYKALDPIHDLKKRGHTVRVIMTEHATRFVSPITFEAISGNTVHRDSFESAFLHIELAKEANTFILAPASYNILGKIAHGIADDLLSTVASLLQCRKIVAPAMNRNMYENPILQKNLQILSDHGYEIIEADEGILACGDEGKGRLSTQLLEVILNPKTSKKRHNNPSNTQKTNSFDFHNQKAYGLFHGKKVLVTAGGTREKIDPVRYIGNFSSGKMGIRMAEAFCKEGAEVFLVYSQISIPLPNSISSLYVESAADLFRVLKEKIQDFDILVMATAVSDYSLDSIYSHKIKEKEPVLHLKKNPDILKELSRNKKSSQIFIGFSAEDMEVTQRSQKKLQEKHIDLIIANDISDPNIAFSSEENEVTLLFSTGKVLTLPRMEKYELSLQILKELDSHFQISKLPKEKIKKIS